MDGGKKGGRLVHKVYQSISGGDKLRGGWKRSGSGVTTNVPSELRARNPGTPSHPPSSPGGVQEGYPEALGRKLRTPPSPRGGQRWS